MAEQASSGTMAEASGDTGAHGLDAQTGLSHGLDSQTGLSHVHETHHGRPASWVASSIIIVGFIVGGAAMVPHPTWWLFWLGAGIVVVGTLYAAAVHIFDDWY